MNENKKENEVNEIEGVKEVEEVIESVNETDDTDTPNLSYQYKINPEYTGVALSRYFRNFVYKRNISYTVVFSIIAVLYVIAIIKNPQSFIFWILAGLCVALIAWLWFKLVSFKSRTVSASELTKDDLYECRIYDSYLKIQIIQMVQNEETGERVEEPSPVKINFKTDFVKVENHNKMFLLFVEQEMTFIIPKDDMDSKTLETFTKFFETNCGDKYVTVNSDNK